MSKMKAVFEVEFDSNMMANDEDVNAVGGWTEMMQWLYLNDGIGIFDSDLKLVRVEDNDNE